MEIDGDMYNIPKYCPVCGSIVPYKRVMKPYLKDKVKKVKQGPEKIKEKE